MNSLLLTPRQRGELEESILNYFEDQGDRFKETISIFRVESGIEIKDDKNDKENEGMYTPTYTVKNR